MCSERDSPLEPFVLPAPGQPELAQLTCGAHLGPPVLTRKQKRPRVNSLVCDRAAVFCAAGPPEALSWMSRLVTQAAKRERELARAHSQRLKQATLSLPGESVSRGFADRGALEGYPSHYTSLNKLTIIASDNGLSLGRHQAYIWTNDGILLIWPLGTNFSENLIEIHSFSLKKMHLKMLSGKWRPFCLGLNVLTKSTLKLQHGSKVTFQIYPVL